MRFESLPVVTVLVLLASCAVTDRNADAQTGFGPSPTLPAPEKGLIPTVNIATAIGWEKDARPVAPKGFVVTALARDLDHPRWVYVLPNGDALVAESDAPPKPEDAKGVKGIAMKLLMKQGGSGRRPSANRITLLRDTNGDGVADTRTVFLQGLNSPFGMTLVGNDLYVANTDAVMRFPYKSGQTEIREPGTKVADLPGGPLNHHWTKNVTASRDGKYLYATVGSNSNVAENGMDKEVNRACILEIDRMSGKMRVFASGLRNPNGLAWEPQTGKLWTTVNERDELGDNLVPDYMTSVKDGGFYGWPYSYFGQNVDERVKDKRPDLVAKAIVPDYALGGHTASLGLAFYEANLFPESYRGGAFIGQHGSWNRKTPSGYKVVFVPFKDGKPAGMPQDFLTGFLNAEGKAQGRPVGVAVDKAGALLVTDDAGDVVWRVSPAAR